MRQFGITAAAFLGAAVSACASGAPGFSSDEARATAADFAAQLESGFLDPAIGAAYGERLRAEAQSGAYDRFDTPEAFAAAATADVQDVYPDGHLKLVFDPPTDDQSNSENGTHSAPRPNFGETRLVADGVIYTEWFEFPGADEEMALAQEIMREHDGARAIIFDLRKHRGGGLSEMDLFFSYLFEEATHLVTMNIREDKGAFMTEMFDATPSLHRKPPAGGVNSWEHWTSPVEGETAWRDAKVYVLTSDYTASAAEHFALAVKTTGRGVLVGEATRGAGNFGSSERIGERFSAFIPVGQTVDPATGKGWEGVGVASDIEVEADQALDKALALATTQK